MKSINVRYGASLTLTATTDESTAETAILYIGKEGMVPVIEKSANFINLVADISLSTEDTKVPLGNYKYQLDVLHSDGRLDKFPTPEDCPYGDLPDFMVYESLSDEEIS